MVFFLQIVSSVPSLLSNYVLLFAAAAPLFHLNSNSGSGSLKSLGCCLQLLHWTHLDIWRLFMFPNSSPFCCSPPFPWGQLSPLEHLTLLQLRARGLAPSTLICKASPAQNKDAIPHISCMQYWKSSGTQTNVGWEGGGVVGTIGQQLLSHSLAIIPTLLLTPVQSSVPKPK